MKMPMAFMKSGDGMGRPNGLPRGLGAPLPSLRTKRRAQEKIAGKASKDASGLEQGMGKVTATREACRSAAMTGMALINAMEQENTGRADRHPIVPGAGEMSPEATEGRSAAT